MPPLLQREGQRKEEGGREDFEAGEGRSQLMLNFLSVPPDLTWECMLATPDYDGCWKCR